MYSIQTSRQRQNSRFNRDKNVQQRLFASFRSDRAVEKSCLLVARMYQLAMKKEGLQREPRWAVERELKQLARSCQDPKILPLERVLDYVQFIAMDMHPLVAAITEEPDLLIDLVRGRGIPGVPDFDINVDYYHLRGERVEQRRNETLRAHYEFKAQFEAPKKAL